MSAGHRSFVSTGFDFDQCLLRGRIGRGCHRGLDNVDLHVKRYQGYEHGRSVEVQLHRSIGFQVIVSGVRTQER
jgi:hypothetical protein